VPGAGKNLRDQLCVPAPPKFVRLSRRRNRIRRLFVLSCVRGVAVEKRELSKIDFDMIDDAFKALLQSSHPDPVEAAKIVDLRDKFRDA
jgi:hypothetical protein